MSVEYEKSSLRSPSVMLEDSHNGCRILPHVRFAFLASDEKSRFAVPPSYYVPSRFNARRGSELACESMATADWDRICWRTNSVISIDTSTSEMRDSAA